MKNILFITYDFPFPTNTGGKNRSYHMLKYTKGEFKKFLFSFVRNDFNAKYFHDLEKIGVEIVGTAFRRPPTDLRNVAGLIGGQSIFKSLYFSKAVLEELLKIVIDKKIEVIHFESYYTAFYISQAFKSLGITQIYGSENVEYKLYEQYANSKGILKPVLDLQVKKIKKEEIEMYKEADAVLAVTQQEVKHIKSHNNNCFEIPNGIDTEAFKFNVPQDSNDKNLLFVGNFTYFPNVSAIESFYKKVFQNLPEDIKLTIIGKKVKTLSFISDPRVKTTEFIEDIQVAYKNADILISPVKIGGGTNFKILEAMAAGVPVIAYEDRSEAIGGENDTHIFVAKNEEDFAEKIVDLLSNFEKRKKIATEARKFVEEKYSWENIGLKLADVWSKM